MSIEYPPEFLAPKPFEEGKIAYEKTFLLQFQPLCPETMFDLSDFQSLMESHQGDRRGNNGGRRQNSERGGRGPRTPSGGQSMSRHGSRDGRGEMGKFASGGRQLSHRSGSNGPNSPGGMERQGSHGGRSRSGRGKGRHNTKQQEGGPTIPLDQVVPLEKSENRWVAKATSDNPEELKTEDDLVPQDIVTRKVKSLLNKLTLEKFDSISDQIVKYALQSEKEDDGTSLRNVVNLIFDKAVDEAAFAAMWARLSRKLLVVVTESSSLKDVNCLDKEGNLQSPMLVFRTYLLNRCQREFLEGWNQDMPELDTNNTEVMMSDEYYAAAKKKRRGLGLVVYIGEMYKLNILSSKIMRQCIHRLVSDPMEVEDAEAETLCKFLTTVGKQMETDNADSKNLLDQTFGVMKVMQTQSEKLSSRVKFMILVSFIQEKEGRTCT